MSKTLTIKFDELNDNDLIQTVYTWDNDVFNPVTKEWFVDELLCQGKYSFATYVKNENLEMHIHIKDGTAYLIVP
jgi:hypothetical protein